MTDLNSAATADRKQQFEEQKKQYDQIDREVSELMKEGRKNMSMPHQEEEAERAFNAAFKKQEDYFNQVKKKHGVSSDLFKNCCIKVVNIANQISISFMKAAGSMQNDQQKAAMMKKAWEMILKSQKMSENNPKCLAMTYNNQACFQRMDGCGHPQIALICLEKALDIESRMIGENDSKAETHLNTCAVLSDLSYHDLAMQHAYQAVMLIQTKLLKDFLPQRPEKSKEKHDITKEYDLQREFKDRIAVLTVAYHNLGVEQEFLNMFHEALSSYREAYSFADRYLGPEDGITKNLRDVYNHAAHLIDKKVKKAKQREQTQEAQRAALRKSECTGEGEPGPKRKKLPSSKTKKSVNLISQAHQQNNRLQKLQAASGGLEAISEAQTAKQFMGTMQNVTAPMNKFVNQDNGSNSVRNRQLPFDQSTAKTVGSPVGANLTMPNGGYMRNQSAGMRRPSTQQGLQFTKQQSLKSKQNMRRNLSNFSRLTNSDAEMMRRLQTQMQMKENAKTFRNPEPAIHSSGHKQFMRAQLAYQPEYGGGPRNRNGTSHGYDQNIGGGIQPNMIGSESELQEMILARNDTFEEE